MQLVTLQRFGFTSSSPSSSVPRACGNAIGIDFFKDSQIFGSRPRNYRDKILYLGSREHTGALTVYYHQVDLLKRGDGVAKGCAKRE